MPTIGEYAESGFIGGGFKAEEDRVRRKKSDLDIQQKQLEVRRKAMEVEDYAYETPARRKEIDVRGERAERELGLGEQLDEKARLAIENDIDKLSFEMEERQYEELVRGIANVNEANYGEFYDSLTTAKARDYGLTGNYKDDKSRIDYITKRGLHNMKQMRDLEQIHAKGRYTATTKTQRLGKPAKPVTYDTNTDLASLRNRLGENEIFQSILETSFLFWKEDPAASPRMSAITKRIATDANSIMTRSYNDADKASSRGQDWTQLTEAEATEMAVHRTAAWLHNPRASGNNLVYMTPEEAERTQNEWVYGEGMELAKTSPNLSKLSNEQVVRILVDEYNRKQQDDYIMRMSRSNQARVFGE